jgi:hypothetical protein
MTATTWNPDTLTTVTLTERQWGTIRTALVCIACDCSTAGNHADADHWMGAYDALKDAMGMD